MPDRTFLRQSPFWLVEDALRQVDCLHGTARDPRARHEVRVDAEPAVSRVRGAIGRNFRLLVVFVVLCRALTSATFRRFNSCSPRCAGPLAQILVGPLCRPRAPAHGSSLWVLRWGPDRLCAAAEGRRKGMVVLPAEMCSEGQDVRAQPSASCGNAAMAPVCRRCATRSGWAVACRRSPAQGMAAQEIGRSARLVAESPGRAPNASAGTAGGPASSPATPRRSAGATRRTTSGAPPL